MITNTRELNTTLHHFISMTDMLTALYLDAKERNDFTLFPTVSESYFIHMRQLSAEIKEYLQAHPEETEMPHAKPSKSAQEEAA